MIAVYNILLIAALILASPLLPLGLLFSPRLRRGLSERLLPLAPMGRDSVWLHTASVGEAEAAAPLIGALLERGVPTLATTLTLTGRERLRSRFPGLRVRLAPLDLPGIVQLSLRRARVTRLVLVETELWPNLIHAACARGVRVVIVSARISDRSFPRYRRLRWLLRPLLGGVDGIGARSDEDRGRFIALGAVPERTRVVGDLKLDRPAAPVPDAALCDALGEGPFLVGGSTHPGEEEALLAAWQGLRAHARVPVRLVLVPRHPERVSEVLKTVRRHGVEPGLRSKSAAFAEVVVVDTIGELDAIYVLADAVFVGGTLARVGGHNLVEPVRAGKVVMHGPHTENQRSQEALLRPLGVLWRVENARELAETLERLWADPERNTPALAARSALAAHGGAGARCLELILDDRATHA